jgi:hypothetical protein
MNQQKNINYLGKSFIDFREDLMNFAKAYFPTTYNDFSPASPGNMFIEMAAYVGDVLSFYQDTQIQEIFPQLSQEKSNLLNLSYTRGYKPKVTTAATVPVDFYQLVPSTISASVTIPDLRYTLSINKNTQLHSNSNSNVYFYIPNSIDFNFSSSLDPLEIKVYQINQTTLQPEYYLLKKSTTAISGEIKNVDYTISNPEKYLTINLNDTNIIGIINITDSNGNIYYEVPYLSQDTIFDEIKNTSLNDPNFVNDNNEVPYLLRLKKIPRRFVTRFKDDGSLDIQFGSGISTLDDEVIIPNPDNVGLGIVDGLSKLDLAFDPSNFLYTDSYGLAPYNTTLTVKYIVGGGIESNIPSNDLTTIDQSSVEFNFTGLDTSLSNIIKNSIVVNNPVAANGGGDGDTNDDLRFKSVSSFGSQLRTVNKEDYITRIYNIPAKYGSISKAYISKDISNSNNPFTLNLYILSYNNDKQLKLASNALKQNIKTYLSQYKMQTDNILIKDGYIINIGVKFEIIVLPNFNSKEVLSNCIKTLKDYFNIDKWQFNQPILISEISTLLDQINGVQTVQKIEIENKFGESLGYSKYSYDIKAATKNNIIYPSIDPSIFEVKYPNNDIIGKIINY